MSLFLGKVISSYLNVFSYKAAGANNTDEYGNLDTVEFLKCVVLQQLANSDCC